VLTSTSFRQLPRPLCHPAVAVVVLVASASVAAVSAFVAAAAFAAVVFGWGLSAGCSAPCTRPHR